MRDALEELLRDAEGVERPSVEHLTAWAVAVAACLPALAGRVVTAEWGSCAPRSPSHHVMRDGAVVVVLGWWLSARPGADVLRQVLHELVHVAVVVEHDECEDGYRGHGPRFCTLANLIGPRVGAPPVAPRARHGAGEPSHWPHAAPLRAFEREEGCTPAEAHALRERLLDVERAAREEAARARAAEERLAAVAAAVAATERAAGRKLRAALRESKSGGVPATARAVARVVGELAKTCTKIAAGESR